MKEFLSREGVSYQEKNVELDYQAAQEMVSQSGQRGVPVTVLAGQTIVGFNQPALQQAVAKLRQTKVNSQNNAPTIKLGAQVADASRVLTQQGQTPQSGAIIGKVQSGSLAARAGLREGDIITSLNGQAVTSADDLAKALQIIVTNKIARPDLIFVRQGLENNTRLPIE